MQDSPAYDDAPSHKHWLQKVQQFRRLRDKLVEDLNSHCNLDLENSNPTFLHDSLAHDDALSKPSKGRRCHGHTGPQKGRDTETRTEVLPVYNLLDFVHGAW